MKTEIAFVLDRSGSMETIRASTIEAFNTFLREQTAAPGETSFSLTLFDTEFEIRHSSRPIAEVPPLHTESYVPGGSTALLDAVGETIDSLGAKLAAMPQADRPGHVTVAILTDGEENSSRRFNWQQVADRIKHQTEVYAWEFLFLGAGPDTIATAGRMNIECAKVALFEADHAGSAAAIHAISRKSSASRSVKSGRATVQEFRDHAAPLADIVREEDLKNRK